MSYLVCLSDSREIPYVSAVIVESAAGHAFSLLVPYHSSALRNTIKDLITPSSDFSIHQAQCSSETSAERPRPGCDAPLRTTSGRIALEG